MKTHFQFLGGSLIECDVNATKDKWVIVKVVKMAQDREHDHWPLINGDFGL